MSARPTDAPKARSARPEVARLAGELFEGHAAELRAIARSHTTAGDDHRAEDAIQNALAAFIQSYNGPIDRADGWRYLIRVVITQAWKLHKREARHIDHAARVELVDGLTSAGLRAVQTEVRDPLESALRREEVAEARARLAELTDEQRLCVWMSACGYLIGTIREPLARECSPPRKSEKPQILGAFQCG